MNTVSQTFNWSRFVAALRKEVVENSRSIAFSIIGIYALLTIFMILGNVVNHTPTEQMIMMEARVPYTVVLLMLSLVVCDGGDGVQKLDDKSWPHKPLHVALFIAREVCGECAHLCGGYNGDILCLRTTGRPHPHRRA